MKILKSAKLTDLFQCEKYLTLSKIPYSFCLRRQFDRSFKRTRHTYPECALCISGFVVRDVFLQSAQELYEKSDKKRMSGGKRKQ